MAAKRNQERVKSILLLAIPDEYLLKFHNVPDAKSLWAAIKARFGGNEESKKMQKNVLKHQFENFTTASNESLDKAYDRFQKLISQLEVHGAPISKEDINQKFLRSLPPSWNQIALIMRNKPAIDLYNNLRVYEDEMKRSSSSTSTSQNLAFLSSENTSSTNEVSTASGDFGVSTAGGISQVSTTPCAHDVACSFFAQPTTSPQLENEDFQQIDEDDLEELDLRWQVAMLTVRVKKFIQKTGRNLDFKEKRLVSLDKSKFECYNCLSSSSGTMRSSDEESTPANDRFSKADGYHAVPPPITRNFLTLRVDISFAGLDKYAIRKKITESKTTDLNTKTSKTVDDEDDVFEVQTVSPVKTNEILKQLKLELIKLGNPEILLQDHAVVDSGCSSHMTGNKAYLSDYEDYNIGFVAFGSDPKRGKITGKGKSRTANLDFDDVYFIDELKFNLFSVSQMCNKKNSVLFTETECLILSPSFKLLDESQVVLRAPRKDDVYSLDLKNIVPSRGIICLYANATTDESKLWHRRLGHVNFKNINKLVKGHLVRGLPSKVFVNDHTYVACKKGKLHKASCKAKLEKIIRNPLELLHMDLFGPVYVESINKKRCDNGTKFKNHAMNEFCAKKGIKSELCVARTHAEEGTQDSYVAGSSGKDKEPTQEYILLPLHPHRTRIPVEDVAPAAHEKPSESSLKTMMVHIRDVADKEGQHQMTEDEQVLCDDLEKMIAQEV
ncbi:putative ribonuclease H-like domain-containing protein [Tanacetum coccineum]